MTKVVVPKNVGSALNKLFQQQKQTEQQANTSEISPQPTDPQYDSVTIGGVVLVPGSSPPLPPAGRTDLLLAPGVFLGDVWVDVEWAPPADGSAATYHVEYARKLEDATYQVESVLSTAGTTMRVGGLLPNATYGFRVYTINRIGEVSQPFPSTGYQDVTTPGDTTVPGFPSGLAISPGFKSVVITWNEVNDPDVKNGNGLYEIDLDVANTFDSPNRRIKRVGGTIVSFSDLIPGQLYFARASSIDSSGNQSATSPVVSTTTRRVENADVSDGAIDDAKIANLSAAKVTFGEMMGDRIKVNSLQVNRLTSSALTSQNIDLAGGQLRVLSGGTTGSVRMLINSQGFNLYNPSGARTVHMDPATGKATLEGATVTGSVFANQPSRRRRKTSSQIVSDITPTYIFWHADVWSEGDVAIGLPTAGRLSAPRKGIYQVTVSLHWVQGPATAGRFEMVVERVGDGKYVAGTIENPGPIPCAIQLSSPIRAVAGDQFRVLVYNVSGGASKTIRVSDLTYFSLNYLSDIG